MIVQVEDRSKIKKVHFKHPYLFGPNAEEHVINMYKDILETDDRLSSARQLVRDLEKELDEKKSTFQELETIMTIEFEKKEANCIEGGKQTLFAIINPTDASNRSYTGQ